MDLKKIAHAYVKHNLPLVQNFSKAFLKKFEMLCIHILEKYQSSPESIEDIVRRTWQTWDNYALSIMYLQIIYYLNISFHKEKIISSFVENSFITHFAKLLLQNIHPDPNERLTIRRSIDIFQLFFYQSNINDLHNYEQILTNYTNNKNYLRKIVFENKADLQKLIKTMVSSRVLEC